MEPLGNPIIRKKPLIPILHGPYNECNAGSSIINRRSSKAPNTHRPLSGSFLWVYSLES